MTAIDPDLLELVVVSEIGFIFCQPFAYLCRFTCGSFTKQMLYQQVIVNMVKIIFQGIISLIV